jgi:hypothetical protein
VVEDGLVDQDDCAAGECYITVLLVSAISICPVAVAMATAFEALDTALRYLTEAEWHPTPLASGSVTWHTLYYFSVFRM